MIPQDGMRVMATMWGLIEGFYPFDSIVSIVQSYLRTSEWSFSGFGTQKGRGRGPTGCYDAVVELNCRSSAISF
jgi:hypothetical protein